MKFIPPHFWIEAVGWTLIHSLWQGALITLVVAAILKLVPSRSSQLNYAAYGVALIVALVSASVTFGSKLLRTDRLTGTPPSAFVPDHVAAVPAVEEISSIHRSALQLSIHDALPAVVGVWFLGVGLMIGRLFLASSWLHRIRKTALPWQDEDWQSKFKDWQEALGLRRAVKLCTTTLSEVPAVIGHFKPIVLLPVAILTQLTPQQLEAVILHELMHVRRNDYLVNLLQVACETLFFFNPAIWWLSRSIRSEREHCCDELVAAYNQDKVGYAKALVRLEELRLGSAGAIALSATGSSLKRRITRLLSPERTHFSLPAWHGVAGTFLLIGATLLFAWPRSIAEEQPEVSFELRSVVEQRTPGAQIFDFKKTSEGPKQLFVSRSVLLNNTHFAAATMVHDRISGRPEIDLRLTAQGRALFSEITRDHVGRQIAILIDKAIVSAPVVREPITGGTFRISGEFTREEAADLVKKLQPEREKASASSSESIAAAPWSPPPNSVPSVVLAEARAEREAGRYEEALARYVWYHTASRAETGQGGVRLSFALSDWLELGRAYPPALDKLREVRDQTGNVLRRLDKTADVFTLFQEYAAINKTLGEDEKTTQLFIFLDSSDREAAKKIHPVAQPSLIRSGELKLCTKYIEPNEFGVILSNLEHHRKMAAGKPEASILRFGHRKFKNSAAILVALLVVKGDSPSAERIAQQALAAMDDPELKTILEAALRGEVPEPWP
jgi:beta-lactamase regulating signal transducer with metallopeptidase domain